MHEGDMLVDFYTHCKTCKYETTIETDDPCNECLEQPTNEYTTKPVMWKEKEKKNAGKKERKNEDRKLVRP